MKKAIGIILTTVILLITAAGWAVGDYFVDFAFKRGDKATMEAPQASIHIVAKDLDPENRPDFPYENWSIIMNNGEQRKGTAFYTDKDTHDWIIMVHGYCRHQAYTWNYAEEYLEASGMIVGSPA